MSPLLVPRFLNRNGEFGDTNPYGLLYKAKKLKPSLPLIIDQRNSKKTCFSNGLSIAILGCGGTCEKKMDLFFNKVRKAYQIFRISKVSTSRQLSTVFS